MKKRLSSILLILAFAAAAVFSGCGEEEISRPDVSISSVGSSSRAASEPQASSASEKSAQSASSESSKTSSTETSSEQTGDPEAVSAQSTSVSSSDSSEESSGTSSAGSASAESSSAETGQAEVSSVASTETSVSGPGLDESEALSVTEDGEYTDKDHVALYLHEFGHLPSNYVSKYDAMDAGWNSREGNLNTVLPGKSIGGDKFGNYEGLLPEKKGRKYYECDIDFNTEGITSEPVYRNEKRIIYSNDGLIFYTEDHYESFEQLY